MKLSDADAIIALVGDQNGLIPAIKEYRRVTGCGLRDAKDAIDKHRRFGGAFDADGFRRENVDIPNPLDLLAEFKVHVHKLEQIIAQFAELCDGFQAETPPPTERVWTGDWRVLRVGDSVKYNGLWYEVTMLVDIEYDGAWPVAIRKGDNAEFWLKYNDKDKEFVEVILK